MGPCPEERRPGDGGATGEYRSGWGGSVTGPRNAAGRDIGRPRNAGGHLCVVWWGGGDGVPAPRNGDPATEEQRASTGVGGEDR